MTVLTRVYRCIALVVTCLLLSASKHTYAEEAALPIYDRVSIEITTHLGDKQIFLEGDKLSFYINLDKSCYLYAFYKDAAGEIFQILPSLAQKNHHFDSGFYIPFPSANSPYIYTVEPPFGREIIYIYASDNPSFEFTDINQGLTAIQQPIQNISAVIESASTKLYGESIYYITTQKKLP